MFASALSEPYRGVYSPVFTLYYIEVFFTSQQKLFIFDCIVVFLLTLAWLEIYQINPKDK